MAKSYDEIVSQMTEDIKSIRGASLGVEVREHIASGMENVLEIFKRLPDAVDEVVASVPSDYTALVNRVADLESCGLTVENGKLCAVYDDGTGGDVSVEHVALGYPSMAMTVGESQPVSATSAAEATRQAELAAQAAENKGFLYLEDDNNSGILSLVVSDTLINDVTLQDNGQGILEVVYK